jgi:predicted ArsR family transcriptional regulator
MSVAPVYTWPQVTWKQRQVHDLLRSDRNLSVIGLARRLGVSHQAVRYRLEALRRKLAKGVTDQVQRVTCERGHWFATFAAEPVCPECEAAT